jgi:hypothetical protein
MMMAAINNSPKPYKYAATKQETKKKEADAENKDLKKATSATTAEKPKETVKAASSASVKMPTVADPSELAKSAQKSYQELLVNKATPETVKTEKTSEIELKRASSASIAEKPEVKEAKGSDVISDQNKFFQINEGKLDVQAKDYIKHNDQDKDGNLDVDEIIESGGLTGDVKTELTAEQLKGLYALMAGPDGKLHKPLWAWMITEMEKSRRLNLIN